MVEILDIKNVSVSFGSIKALKNVTLKQNQNIKIAGIIGPNGAGKSTLLSVIAGEIKPKAEKLEILGKELSRNLSPERLCEYGLARTFQIPRPFNGMTVEENVVVSGLVKKNLKDSRIKAKQLLEVLDLDTYSDAFPSELNLAERKRLELARALITEPKLLLLDELFEGLNDIEVEKMIKIIRQEIVTTNTKIILVEHVMSAVRNLAEWLYVLDQGQLIGEGETTEVLSSKVVIEAYLGKQ